ncbi:unnamed protein product, partial [Heterosigma akashiwo]
KRPGGAGGPPLGFVPGRRAAADPGRGGLRAAAGELPDVQRLAGPNRRGQGVQAGVALPPGRGQRGGGGRRGGGGGRERGRARGERAEAAARPEGALPPVRRGRVRRRGPAGAEAHDQRAGPAHHRPGGPRAGAALRPGRRRAHGLRGVRR